MPTLTTIYGLRLSHYANGRLYFEHLFCEFRRTDFRDQFKRGLHPDRPIQLPGLVWYGFANELLSQVLRDGFVAIEAYVSMAVFFEALLGGRPAEGYLEATKDPVRELGGGTADATFNRLPRILSDAFALSQRDPPLWEDTRVLYREVRNPLFHSYQLESADPDPVLKVYEHLWRLFRWADTWHDPRRIVAALNRGRQDLPAASS